MEVLKLPRRYVAASTVAALGVVCHALKSREHPAMMYLSTSQVGLAVLLNMAVVILYGVWRLLKAIFLGPLLLAEEEQLMVLLEWEGMRVLYAMVLFQDDLNVSCVALIAILLFVKALQSLAQTRVQYLDRATSVQTSLRRRFLSHARIISFTILLLTLNGLLVHKFTSHLLQTTRASVAQFVHYLLTIERPSISLFFALEYIQLAVGIFINLFKYFLYLVDMAIDKQWAGKTICTSYLDLLREFSQLCSSFFLLLVVFRSTGLPIRMLKDIHDRFWRFLASLADFMNIIDNIQVASEMNILFPDATLEELTRDTTCIICLQEMSEAKKLPCGHLFHNDCLGQWLILQQTCPTCRASVQKPELEVETRNLA
ncbi:unnamed protein product [Calypogeia fissa]